MSPRLKTRRHIAVRILRWTGILMMTGVVALFAAAAVFYAHAASTLPPVPPFESLAPSGATLLHARDGQVIGEFYDEHRMHLDLRLEDIPVGVIYALLAAEDERFFEHTGFDIRGFLRAVWTNLVAGRFVEGASTISQQLAKDILGRPKSFGHDPWLSLHQKARETAFARRMHGAYEPEQILVLYLNRVYFGRGAYGIRAAAHAYFDRELHELALEEMAFLAGLPQSPSILDPRKHPERARRRTSHVLGQMARNGFITAEELAEAQKNVPPATVIRRRPVDRLLSGAPHYARAVLRELRRRFGKPDEPDAWRRMELDVQTGADLWWQRQAEAELTAGLTALDHQQGYRGPLLRLPAGDEARFDERVAAALEESGLRPNRLWPARVVAVDKKGIDVRLGARPEARIPLANMTWAGSYDEKKPSFGRKLRDATKAFAKGDVILVTTDEEGAFHLGQEPQVEGAIVALEPGTGMTRVLHGGYDFDRSEVDRTRSVRQTGSAIKPAIYSLAYERGLSPSMVLSGAPFREGDYSPTQGKAADDLLVWDALAASENNVSLRVMNYVQKHAGANGLAEWIALLGLDQPMQGYTAEVLGTDQTPRGMTRMMATFAARGRRIEPRLLHKVRAKDGRVLVRPTDFRDPMNEPVDVLDALVHDVARPPMRDISEATAYLTTANLREVFRRGTARKEGRKFSHPACGKTGTLGYDVWFTGFTADVAATVWIGAERRERLLGAGKKRSRVYGANTALPVWRRFLTRALEGRPERDPVGPPPHDVVIVEVDPKTGWLQAGGRAIPHRKGTEPTRQAPTSPEAVDTDLLQMQF